MAEENDPQYDPYGPVQVQIEGTEGVPAAAPTPPIATQPPVQGAGLSVVPAPAQEQEPLYTHVPLQWSDGRTLELYSTSGAKTESEFDKAAYEYKRTNKAPRGFETIDPVTTNWLMDKFLNVKNTIQPFAAKTGRAALQGASDIVTQPFSQQVQEQARGTAGGVGTFLGNTVASPLDSPESFGTFLATSAVAPLLGPVNVPVRSARGAIQEGLPYAFSFPGAVRNIGVNAGAAGVGGIVGNLATDRPITLGDTGLNVAMSGLGAGSFQAMIQHIVTRNIPRNMQQKVNENILKGITDKYSILKNNPDAIRISGDAGYDLTQIGKQMANGLRGTPDNIGKNMTDDLLAVMPKRVEGSYIRPVLNRRVRNLADAGNAVIDSMGTSDEAQALKDFVDATTAVGEVVRNQISTYVTSSARKGAKPPNVIEMAKKVNDILLRYRNELDNFREGITNIRYFNQAIDPETKRFSQDRLKDALLSSNAPQTGLPGEIGQILSGGPGTNLTNLPPFKPPQMPGAGFVRGDKIDKLLSWIGAQPRPSSVPTLPSHIPFGGTSVGLRDYPGQLVKPQTLINIGSEAAGQDAIRRFLSGYGPEGKMKEEK